MSAVEITNLSKAFGASQVLNDISLRVEDGEFVALLGPSGCGKSTLLRLLAGLDEQDTGAIELGGIQIDQLKPSVRDIAMVFQSYALYPHLTVSENIASPLRVKRLNAVERFPLIGRFLPCTRRKTEVIFREVSDVADMLDIGHLLHKKPGKLSGGQRQRVAIGRAVIRQPRLFLMDEPLSNLDYNLRVQMRNELVQLHRRLQATIIYITHDQAEAMAMADKIAVMKGGRIMQFGTPEQIHSDPATLDVATFVGTPKINLIQGYRNGVRGVECGSLCLPVSLDFKGHEVTIAVRPEAIDIGRPDAPGWIGELKRVERLGNENILHVCLESGLGDILVRQAPFGQPRLREGDHLSLQPRLDQILFFDSAGNRLRFFDRGNAAGGVHEDSLSANAGLRNTESAMA